jgi:dTDP-4-dehydrorhamnose 3,5-epimerase-like enzyme
MGGMALQEHTPAISPAGFKDAPTVDSSGHELVGGVAGVEFVRLNPYDGRVDSPTFERFQQIWFSEGAGGLVRIPPGVWHADQNWGETDLALVNFPTHPYEHADPDKYRIDPHSGEIAFDWTRRDG